MSGFEITENNIAEIEKKVQQAIKVAMLQCGMVAETTAKRKLEENHKSAKNGGATWTGNLANSVTHQEETNGSEATMTVGTNVEYAEYVEYGTGIANVAGGTPKPSWVYFGEDGKFHRAFPQPPRPFIKPAVADNKEAFRKIFEQELGSSVTIK